jgi:hypothetical protein
MNSPPARTSYCLTYKGTTYYGLDPRFLCVPVSLLSSRV